jgi:hypothetical protein
LSSEISSYRRKVSSLEKERQHLQSTVEALQEEKKLLHSKLRNTSVTEKVNIIEKPSADKRDASTATEDLDTGESSSSETLTSAIDTVEDGETSVSRSNNVADFTYLEEVSSSIPHDQLRMIDNINSLMSEVISLMCKNPVWLVLYITYIDRLHLNNLKPQHLSFIAYKIYFLVNSNCCIAVGSGARRVAASFEN